LKIYYCQRQRFRKNCFGESGKIGTFSKKNSWCTEKTVNIYVGFLKLTYSFVKNISMKFKVVVISICFFFLGCAELQQVVNQLPQGRQLLVMTK